MATDGQIRERLAEGKVEGAPSRHPIHELLRELRAAGRLERVEAVGHRVVHGGRRLTDPVRVDAARLEELDRLFELAPLHNPPAVAGIRETLSALPGIPQIAVFDIAFHAGMPPTGARHAVPREWEDRFGVRRYGFHGLAHRWLAERCAEIANRDLGSLRLVTLQLGSGCSAAAASLDAGSTVNEVTVLARGSTDSTLKKVQTFGALEAFTGGTILLDLSAHLASPRLAHDDARIDGDVGRVAECPDSSSAPESVQVAGRSAFGESDCQVVDANGDHEDHGRQRPRSSPQRPGIWPPTSQAVGQGQDHGDHKQC